MTSDNDRDTPVTPPSRTLELARILVHELDDFFRRLYTLSLPPLSDDDADGAVEIVRARFREVLQRAIEPERVESDRLRSELDRAERHIKYLETELNATRNAMRTK